MILMDGEYFKTLLPTEKTYLQEKNSNIHFKRAYKPLTTTLEECEELYFETDEIPVVEEEWEGE